MTFFQEMPRPPPSIAWAVPTMRSKTRAIGSTGRRAALGARLPALLPSASPLLSPTPPPPPQDALLSQPDPNRAKAHHDGQRPHGHEHHGPDRGSVEIALHPTFARAPRPSQRLSHTAQDQNGTAYREELQSGLRRVHACASTRWR